MSFWTDFEASIHTAIINTWAEIEKIGTLIKPMAIATAEDVATIALGAVMQQAPLVLSGSIKLANATASVISTLASQGKSVVASQAEAAVQATYNELSSKLNAAKPAG
jgi:hypothetical protein